MALTKQEILDQIATATEVPKATVEKVIGDFIGLVFDELDGDAGEFTYPRLGKFEKKYQPAREGRNPATGEAMTIQAKNVVRYKPAAELRRWVNGES